MGERASRPAGNVVDTPAGPVARVTTTLGWRDRLGSWRVRWNIRRGNYKVRPGLYAVGRPDKAAPVLVTANYKLSFDTLRSSLTARDAWVLVLDTRGVNVWCAAGKGTFGTRELVRRIRETRLEQVVSHRRLVLPQLGATGVAGHEVRAATGFRVRWGPVRAADIPAFLDDGMRATPSMRRVTFTLAERAVLIPVEISFFWRPWPVAVLIVTALLGGWSGAFGPDGFARVPGAVAVAVAAAALGGAVIVPILLPWIPGRAFSFKGGLVGMLSGALVAWIWFEPLGPVLPAFLILLSAAIASFVAMNFTGSTTFTSPSGVEWEMRRALPLQIAGVALWILGALIPWEALAG